MQPAIILSSYSNTKLQAHTIRRRNRENLAQTDIRLIFVLVWVTECMLVRELQDENEPNKALKLSVRAVMDRECSDY